jgi:hypothetical protein
MIIQSPNYNYNHQMQKDGKVKDSVNTLKLLFINYHNPPLLNKSQYFHIKAKLQLKLQSIIN